jgi:hypothetical protein
MLPKIENGRKTRYKKKSTKQTKKKKENLTGTRRCKSTDAALTTQPPYKEAIRWLHLKINSPLPGRKAERLLCKPRAFKPQQEAFSTQ